MRLYHSQQIMLIVCYKQYILACKWQQKSLHPITRKFQISILIQSHARWWKLLSDTEWTAAWKDGFMCVWVSMC